MKYTWDERKRRTNLRKHKIDFQDAIRIFDGPFVSDEDTRIKYSETRFKAYGVLFGILLQVVYTNVSGNETRIISSRKATRHEEERFKKYFKR